MSQAGQVLGCLRRQQEKYRELMTVVASQRSVFSSMDVDAILTLIEQKRAILAEVDRLDAELVPLKAQWDQVRSAFTPEEAREIGEALEETQRVLSELMKIEDEGRAAFERGRPGGKEGLRGLLQQSRARNAYDRG